MRWAFHLAAEEPLGHFTPAPHTVPTTRWNLFHNTLCGGADQLHSCVRDSCSLDRSCLLGDSGRVRILITRSTINLTLGFEIAAMSAWQSSVSGWQTSLVRFACHLLCGHVTCTALAEQTFGCFPLFEWTVTVGALLNFFFFFLPCRCFLHHHHQQWTYGVSLFNSILFDRRRPLPLWQYAPSLGFSFCLSWEV